MSTWKEIRRPVPNKMKGCVTGQKAKPDNGEHSGVKRGRPVGSKQKRTMSVDGGVEEQKVKPEKRGRKKKSMVEGNSDERKQESHTGGGKEKQKTKPENRGRKKSTVEGELQPESCTSGEQKAKPEIKRRGRKRKNTMSDGAESGVEKRRRVESEKSVVPPNVEAGIEKWKSTFHPVKHSSTPLHSSSPRPETSSHELEVYSHDPLLSGSMTSMTSRTWNMNSNSSKNTSFQKVIIIAYNNCIV